MNAQTNNKIVQITSDTLEYSRHRNYTGYDKADGMSSQILQSIPLDNKWLNILFQESAKRTPVNIRPLLFVEQRRNFKGTALFAIANINMWEITENAIFKHQAISCLDWLIENKCKGYAGFCGGHPHPVQGLTSKSEPYIPDIVDTSYSVRAFLQGSYLSTEYYNEAISAADFVFEDLDYHEIETGARIKYKPTSSGKSFTLNANALGARGFIDLYKETGKERFLNAGTNILRYVASHQSENGGWEYRDPPSASHLGMDNYHNGFIIESFLRYQEVVNSEAFEDTVDDGLEFYRDILYEDNGAPCWDESSAYPRDIHAAAQGIIVFTHAGDLEFARRIIDWTIDNLYAGDGQFYYQMRKHYTKRFTLMRWCQAWMAYALSEYLLSQDQS